MADWVGNPLDNPMGEPLSAFLAQREEPALLQLELTGKVVAEFQGERYVIYAMQAEGDELHESQLVRVNFLREERFREIVPADATVKVADLRTDDSPVDPEAPTVVPPAGDYGNVS